MAAEEKAKTSTAITPVPDRPSESIISKAKYLATELRCGDRSTRRHQHAARKATLSTSSSGRKAILAYVRVPANLEPLLDKNLTNSGDPAAARLGW